MLEIAPVHLTLVRRLVANRLPGLGVIAFGSRVARWPFGRGIKPYSDLDLAVIANSAPDDLALAELRADLEESSLPWRVDIVTLDDLPDDLRQLVLQQGVIVQAQAGAPATAPPTNNLAA